MNAHQDAQEGQQAAAPAGVASVPTVDAAAVLRFHRRMETRASGYKGFCSECGLKWFGPPDVGGCEAVLLARRVALLEGLLRDLVTKGEAMKEAFFTGDDTREAIACMEWDDAVAAALADGG